MLVELNEGDGRDPFLLQGQLLERRGLRTTTVPFGGQEGIVHAHTSGLESPRRKTAKWESWWAAARLRRNVCDVEKQRYGMEAKRTEQGSYSPMARQSIVELMKETGGQRQKAGCTSRALVGGEGEGQGKTILENRCERDRCTAHVPRMLYEQAEFVASVCREQRSLFKSQSIHPRADSTSGSDSLHILL